MKSPNDARETAARSRSRNLLFRVADDDAENTIYPIPFNRNGFLKYTIKKYVQGIQLEHARHTLSKCACSICNRRKKKNGFSFPEIAITQR